MTFTIKNIATCALSICASGCFFINQALAQTYPSRPIRLVVPTTPGGSTDILARHGSGAEQSLGTERGDRQRRRRRGAIGADKVAKAPADGYTLLMGHIGTLAVNPSLYPKLPYDPIKDFAPVAWVARVPNVLVVNPAVGATNVKELIALAKSKPVSLNDSSGGNGSAAN